MGVDPCDVLISKTTVGNEVGYQLKGSCAWLHLDLTSQNSRPLWGGDGGRRESVTDFGE